MSAVIQATQPKLVDVSEAPALSEDQLHALKQRMAAFDKLLAENKKGKYKIEVMLGSDYRSGQAYPGMLSLWESGAKLHGGGDTKVYECPASDLGVSDCAGIIPDASQGFGHLVCPRCQKLWQSDQVTGERFARLTTAGWATLIYRFFVRVDHNADIYLKRVRADIRAASEKEQAKQHMGEKLAVARKKEVVIYPFANILKDLNAGADPIKRFRALLSS